MNIEVTRYRKADGYVTRYWSVRVNGELLVVTLYRKGAEAVARAITNTVPHDPVATLEDSPKPGISPAIGTHGMVTDQPA